MKKTMLLLLAAGLIAMTAVACAGTGVTADGAGAAYEPEIDIPVVETDDGYEEIADDGSDIIFDDDVNIVLPGEGEDFNIGDEIAHYFFVTGNVVSIEEFDGYTHVTIEDTNGNPAVLVLSEDTVFPFAEDFEIGDTVTGWYQTDMPMIMIWPPQYNIAVLAAGAPEDVVIRVDRFHSWDESMEGYMLSQDLMFAFNTDENTEIVLADGQDFSDGELNGRRIVVIYGMSTKSLPERATAQKLIVLFESIMPLA